MALLRTAAVLLLASGGLAGATLPALAQPGPRMAFANPQQPWVSPDGQVHLLRPLIARVSTDATPVGALMSPGWRLIWDGSSPTPGRLEVRLALKVRAQPPETRTTEYLQVGVSRAPADVRTCLTYGLRGGSGRRLPDRVINGRRFAVWGDGDGGMSQTISATDLRTVAGGACWAVERFSYSDSASDPDPTATLPQAEGAAMMDRALASLQLGSLRPGEAIAPPHLRLPPGARAY